ncbi:uncharacterized FCP1 homology domain-containing protein C1271.03c-like [Coffea eugenioides]|uniref:uncharacterized FCP1 homology domain-containing protein C1271.03c-like n=1 Tax=Coffea eugenioides TaxID=49369 RepID=UPI000F60926F|nr:uncharacterized FCP1 homology domain-containing protein C1271.03c-like [Coffea eugenioides]
MIVHVTEKEIYIVDPLQNDTTFYDGIMHLLTHARIARKFMALEIAMSKLADPFNYASFLNDNKLGKETEVQGVQTERPLARITRAASRKASNSKLLILDLNGVILAKNSNDRYDFKFRPYTHEFLKFCFSCFNVAIWSSKQWHNVQRVIKNLPHFKWEFVWNQAHCTVVETKTKENPEKKIMFKDLRKVWKDFEQYGLSNTLLVDDSPYKSFLNPRYNAIFPESYAFSSEKDNYLDPKGEFAQHLKKLAEADNVEEFIKQNPFGQPPIIEESDEWTAAVREDKEVKVLGMKDLFKVQMFQWREALGEEVNGQ